MPFPPALRPALTTPQFAPRPVSRIITPYSIESIGGTRMTAAQASTAWPSANLAIFVPFQIAPGQVFRSVRAFIANGATANGDVDIGVYDESYNRLASTGAVAQSGTSNLQDLAALAITLTPGRYYLAMSLSSGTGTALMTTGYIAGGLASYGCFQQAAAHPLPNPAVPAVYAQTVLPLFGLSSQAVF